MKRIITTVLLSAVLMATTVTGNTYTATTSFAAEEEENQGIDLYKISYEGESYCVGKDVTNIFSGYDSRDDYYYMDGLSKDFESITAKMPNLKELTVEEGNENLNAEDGILYLTSTKELAACPLLKAGKISVPEGTEMIGKGSFFGNKGITEVEIPASVTDVGVAAFGENSSLTSIAVSKENKKYVSVDGVLYTKDMSELISYPAAKKETNFHCRKV